MREKDRLDSLAGLVVGPKVVAERLDDVIGRNADVRGALLEHLQNGLQHADHRAEWAVLTLVEAAQPVKVPKQLVGAVYDVDDHAALCRSAEGVSEVGAA